MYSYATESPATQLRRDDQKMHENEKPAMRLESMYNVFMDPDSLAKYEDEHRQLAHVNKKARNLRGHMYFWKHELACFVSIEQKGDKNWIDTLEVCKPFRGQLLSMQLLDVAVKKFKATDLKVHKDNHRAIHIFEKYGFLTYDKKNDYLYMTIDESTKKKEAKLVPETKAEKEAYEEYDKSKSEDAKEAVGYFLSKEELYGAISTKWDDDTKIQFYPTIEMALSCEHRDITSEEFYVIAADNVTLNSNYEAIESVTYVNTVDHIRVGLGVESAIPELRAHKCFDWKYKSIDM